MLDDGLYQTASAADLGILDRLRRSPSSRNILAPEGRWILGHYSRRQNHAYDHHSGQTSPDSHVLEMNLFVCA